MDLGIKRPRNKYADVSESYLSFISKKKRKRKALKNTDACAKLYMIELLWKAHRTEDEIHEEYGRSPDIHRIIRNAFPIIRKVLVQEKELFEGRKVNDRIVASTVITYVLS